ncbi:MAG TPA: helix-turn-helix transcriptional regulator, partial [Polyangiaceae bacterium]|nr:helix-turn-helix transcriptional regulator [Polyangiaceae bacterium]
MTMPARSAQASSSSFGSLLQHWRRLRHFSQLSLAMHAGVSAKHLCFVETGRAKPSREMVLLLAGALDVPLREQNMLLLAAGFAPEFAESALDAPELAAVRRALDAILRQQEPFPAVVLNRRWDILHRNDGARRFFGFLVGERANTSSPNVLRMMFHPDGLRPFVSNWLAVGEALIRRAHREAVGGVPDPSTRTLLDEVLSYPGVRATGTQ